MAVAVKRLLEILNEKFPTTRAEDGDPTGLQVAPLANDIKKVVLALDPRPEVLKEALEQEATLIITHHPLIFKPVYRIGREDLLRDFINSGIGLFVAHTNFDRDYLVPFWADRLGLNKTEPLAAEGGEAFYKLVVYIPPDYVETIREIIFERGGGWTGDYDKTSFGASGKGTFRPRSGAKPFIGEEGELAEVDEIRLETIVPARFLPGVIEAVKNSHPYEEPAFDVFSLAHKEDRGLGIIGDLHSPAGLGEIVKLLREAGLEDNFKLGRVQDRPRQKVALIPGKGGKYISAAASAGADIFISGDLDFHQFHKGQDLDLLLVDPGHFQLEIVGKNIMRDILTSACPQVDWIISERENPPYFFNE